MGAEVVRAEAEILSSAAAGIDGLASEGRPERGGSGIIALLFCTASHHDPTEKRHLPACPVETAGGIHPGVDDAPGRALSAGIPRHAHPRRQLYGFVHQSGTG